MSSAYMPIADVANELGISPSGVYKLIQRGKLPAIRRSERGLRVPRIAFDAYARRLQGESHTIPPAVLITQTVAEARRAFEADTGLTPKEWERRWKAEQIEDSAENMTLSIRALGLLLRETEDEGIEDERHGEPRSARSAA